MHNMKLKTLQGGHWDVQEFFYRKKGTFLHFQRAPGSSAVFDFFKKIRRAKSDFSPGEFAENA